jgi:hypothetical protein
VHRPGPLSSLPYYVGSRGGVKGMAVGTDVAEQTTAQATGIGWRQSCQPVTATASKRMCRKHELQVDPIGLERSPVGQILLAFPTQQLFHPS